MKIGFIGAGKMGFSLGRYFSENGLYLTGYFGHDIQSATEAAKFTGSKPYSDVTELIRDSDTIFLTVPDNAIGLVYEQIKELGISGKQLCHCSCALSASQVFPDISSYGASGCSISMLYPVSSKYDSFKELHKAFVCIEGSSEHISEWAELFGRLGNTAKIIESGHKTEFNAACTIATDMLCALADSSISLIRKCGFSESEALAALEPVVLSNIKRIFTVGPVNAMLGAVESNDVYTVKCHINSIENDTNREMYRAVSRKLLDTAQEKHPDIDYSAMKKLLK